ncbi:MAG: MaoC family dehydratase N-terminal domain-containing protein [Spirochaetes bacterium]|nr:MaoC family dehydratase N-terminal domain-containing protein [Spirochaetota bacterium]
MHLDSSFTGTTLREYKTTVQWRHMMNYAAAVDDPNEAYFNDERDTGVIAHPMLAAAVTWPITERIGEFIESASFPRELILTQVHFTELLEFHRSVVPGDELTVRGVITAIQPHRAGTHVIIRFAAADARGVPVFTEYIGGMMRGVECRGGARGVETVPAVPRADAEEPGWETKVHIGPMAPFIYDGCTDIVFPIHTSRKFARQVGLPGIIFQGTATLAHAVREVVNREAGGDPARLKRLFCKFTGMVLPGTDIRIQRTGRGETAGGMDIFFSVLNGDGQRAISGGYAQITQ